MLLPHNREVLYHRKRGVSTEFPEIRQAILYEKIPDFTASVGKIVISGILTEELERDIMDTGIMLLILEGSIRFEGIVIRDEK